MFFVSYCRPSKFNKNIPISSHTSAPSYASIETSNRSLPFFIHVCSWLKSKDLREWYITFLSWSSRLIIVSAKVKASVKSFFKIEDLHRISNRNRAKVRYSCTKNMKTIINNHNKNVLKKKPPIDTSTSNCRNKEDYPLNGQY